MLAQDRLRCRLAGVCGFLALSVGGRLCSADPSRSHQLYPVVAHYRGEVGAEPMESPVRDAADGALAEADEERVVLNPDGTISFDCPKAICEKDFFFGKSILDENGAEHHRSPSLLTDSNDPHAVSSQGAERPRRRASVSTHNDDGVAREKHENAETLQDRSEVSDMTYLGIDEGAHKLGFSKASTCGGLYSSSSQLPPATPDLACSVGHLDEHSIYLKRLQSNRFRIGTRMELAMKMSGAFTLDAADRIRRKKLTHSTSLRMLVFLARAFGRLKPNLLKTNPGTIMNRILLERKHLYYPLAELCVFIKACVTNQHYPERVLQGYPNHAHPNDPAYLDLPIFSYLRRVGAEVAFPRNAPTLFEPRIYDGNKLVERKQGPAKTALFGAIRGFFGQITYGNQQTKAPDNATAGAVEALLDEATAAAADLGNFAEDGDAQPPEVPEEYDSSTKPHPPTKDAWKKQTYRTWHNLWVLNILIYQASDMWPWMKHHKADTFAFAPWKVKFVGVLRTTEAAPMRWRDLSPRFSVEPFAASEFEMVAKEGIQHPLFWGGTPTSLTVESLDANAENLTAFRSAELSSDSGLEGEPGFQSKEEPVRHGGSYSNRFLSIPPFPSERGDARSNAEHPAETATEHEEASSSKGRSDRRNRNRRRRAASKDSEAIDSLVDQIEKLASMDIASHDEHPPPPLPAGCSAMTTDMSFFKKAGQRYGRLRLHGPALVNPEPVEGQSEQNPGWRPKVQGSEVECPPQLHLDTCGLTATFNRPYEAPWIWLLERDETQIPKGNIKKFDYPDLIWIFRGTFVSKLWIINGMAVAVPYRPLSKVGRFHYGMIYLFDKTVRHLLDKHLRELKERLKGRQTPLTIVFTGHSLGAAIAEMSSWYFAKRTGALIQQGRLIVRTVTFGSPSWGNAAAYEDMHKSGALTQEVNLDIDPVWTLFGEESLSGLLNKKPFQMQFCTLSMKFCTLETEVLHSRDYSPEATAHVALLAAFDLTSSLGGLKIQLHVQDMDQVEVASSVPGEPPFSGRVWTRPNYRPTTWLKKLAAMVFRMEDVDMLLLDPGISHFAGYTAALTLMAGLLDEASYGSGVAAPFSDNSATTGHAQNVQMKTAHQKLRTILRRVEADRLAED